MPVMDTAPPSSAAGARPVILARGKPFSFDALDMTLPLAKITSRLHSSVERHLHFELRLDYHLPVLLSLEASEERRIAAAYLCHQPYRSVVAQPDCQPFREVLCNLMASTAQASSDAAEETTAASPSHALRYVLEILLYGSDREVESLASHSPQELVEEQSSAAGPSSGVSSRIAELVKKATIQTLSMGEQRMLASILSQTDQRSVDAVTPDVLPPVWLAPLIRPDDLILAGANSPMITCEMVARLCQEAIQAESHGKEQGKAPSMPLTVPRYLGALQRLPPTLRSFDLVTRLLRSDRLAPAPSEEHASQLTPSDEEARPQRPTLVTTVSHISRLYVLGGFLSNSVRYLERRESDEEASILSEAAESGLPEPSRREVEEMLEDRMAREVSIFCHFIRSLINAALLFPPDLGVLRRQISSIKEEAAEAKTKDGGGEEEGGAEPVGDWMDAQLQAMEAELESNSQAILVELQHFALHFGRYRDGMRLYSELTSLA